jgi:hypothetical protein
MPIPSPVALHHTAFLVRDLEGTAQALANALSVGPWRLYTMHPTASKVRGRDSAFTFRVALATVGGGTFELVAPHTGWSVFDELLERDGPGFHHTCLVYPSLADLRAAKTELLRQGRELIQEASAGDAFDFGYFLFPEIGSAIELLYIDVSQLPPPDAVIEPAA